MATSAVLGVDATGADALHPLGLAAVAVSVTTAAVVRVPRYGYVPVGLAGRSCRG